MLNVKHAEVEGICFKIFFLNVSTYISGACRALATYFLNDSLDLMLLHSGLSIRSFAETGMKDAFISDEKRRK
jgi:hypothetical protein